MSSKEKQGKIITSSWVARRINAKLFKQLNKSNWQEIEREAQTYLPIPNAPQVTHEKEELVGYTDTFFAEARYLWYGINGRYEGIHEEKVRFERSTPLDQVKVKIRNICRRPRATEASYEHSSTLIEYGTYAVSHSLKEHKEGFHLKIVKGIHMLGQKRNDVESSSACRKALLRVYHQLKK